MKRRKQLSPSLPHLLLPGEVTMWPADPCSCRRDDRWHPQTVSQDKPFLSWVTFVCVLQKWWKPQNIPLSTKSSLVDPATGPTAQAAHLSSWLLFPGAFLACPVPLQATALSLHRKREPFYQPPDAQATPPNILVSSLLTSKSTLSHQALTYCASCRSVSRVLLCPMCTTAMWVGPAHNYSMSALWTSLSAGSFP